MSCNYRIFNKDSTTDLEQVVHDFIVELESYSAGGKKSFQILDVVWKDKQTIVYYEKL